MSEPKPSSSGRQKRLLLALPVLLVVAAAANWSSIAKIASGEKSLRSVIYGFTEGHNTDVAGWKLPSNMGDGKARVTVEVFVMPGDPCHFDTVALGQALGTLDPQRIRVKFSGAMPGSADATRRDKLKLGCDQGLAINGKTEFAVPDPARPGKKKTLFLTPKGQGLSLDNLYVVLGRELATAYQGKGLAMTGEGFALQVQNEMTQRREAAIAEAKARQEAEQAKKDGG